MGVGRTDSVGRAKVLAINYASHLTVPQDSFIFYTLALSRRISPDCRRIYFPSLPHFRETRRIKTHENPYDLRPAAFHPLEESIILIGQDEFGGTWECRPEAGGGGGGAREDSTGGKGEERGRFSYFGTFPACAHLRGRASAWSSAGGQTPPPSRGRGPKPKKCSANHLLCPIS